MTLLCGVLKKRIIRINLYAFLEFVCKGTKKNENWQEIALIILFDR